MHLSNPALILYSKITDVLQAYSRFNDQRANFSYVLHQFLVGIEADVESRAWSTLPTEEGKQARQGQLGFRNNFDNVTDQYQFFIIRAVPDERDLQFKGVRDDY